MRRVATVLLVLATIAAVEGAPENDEATVASRSECYDCHNTNPEKGSGPTLIQAFRMFMIEAPDLDPGASTQLSFTIRNWWTAELQGFSGFIDLSEAPAFAFESPRDPVSGSQGGTLPAYDPTEYYQGEERSAQVSMEVDAGGTDLDFMLAPEADSDADLILRIWSPTMDPQTDPPLAEVDDAGAGAPEVFALSEDPVQGGTYTVEAAEVPATFDAQVGMFDAVGFTVDWTLQFKFEAGDPVRAGGSNVVLDGQDDDLPQNTPISWPVNVVRNITEEQHIRVYMESVAFYDHPPQFQAVDEWLFWNDVHYFVVPEPDGSFSVQRLTPDGDRVTEFIVDEQVVEVTPGPNEEPDLTDEVTPPLDIASEVIGYMAGMVLIVSLVTGGAFGNWSRKLQKRLLFGRSKNRVNFHNVVSYGLILLALAHMVLFLVEPKYPWTVGFFLGGVSIFGMVLSGVTGAYQIPMLRVMTFESWRWLHFLSFVLTFAGALGHVLLDGIHFAEFQAAVGWQDPVAPALQELIPIDNTTTAEPPP